jgi:hypothetical protein
MPAAIGRLIAAINRAVYFISAIAFQAPHTDTRLAAFFQRAPEFILTRSLVFKHTRQTVATLGFALTDSAGLVKQGAIF